MDQKNMMTKSALAISIALISSSAFSAGFQLNEFSATGLGRAYSGEGAMADNASSAARNPATMMLLNRPAISGGVVYIDPKVDISGTSPSGASLNANDIAPSEWVPNLHFVYPVDPQWAVGFSAFSGYGLSTKYDNDYTAGPYGGKTELITENLNLNGAYRLDDHFSFGLGFDAVYAKATLNRYAGESAGQLNHVLGLSLSPSSEISHLEGNRWGYGWNAGLLYEVDPNNRFGLTYRSEIKIKFDGNYSSDLPSAINQLRAITNLPYGTDGNTIPANLTLDLPEIWEISAYHRIAPQWAVHYSMMYTSWSQFQELKATGSGNNTLFIKHEGFRDAYRIALGTTYDHDENWTFRTGVAFDDSPVPAENRSISIPDQDRFWVSAGTTYHFNKDASVDLGVSYMHGQNVTIKEGPYTFQSQGTAMLYGVNMNYSF